MHVLEMHRQGLNRQFSELSIASGNGDLFIQPLPYTFPMGLVCSTMELVDAVLNPGPGTRSVSEIFEESEESEKKNIN